MDKEVRNRKVPLILRIDVEPDGLFIDPQKPLPWRRYEAAYEFFRAARSQLAAATTSPVHFSWLFRLDPQIVEAYGAAEWAMTHYPAYLADFEEHGDEVGLHTHAYRWEAGPREWLVDHGNQPWVDHCVRVSFEAYRRVLHRECRTFSFGDGWMNNQTLALVERLGSHFELTVEPGYRHSPPQSLLSRYSGMLPDYGDVPQVPYRPSKADFRASDWSRKSGIWIIPVSTGCSPYGVFGALHHRIRHPAAPWSRIKTLNLMHHPRTFIAIANRLLGGLEKPYLQIVVRTDVFQKPHAMRNLRHNIRRLVQHPAVKDFVFSTPGETIQLLGCA